MIRIQPSLRPLVLLTALVAACAPSAPAPATTPAPTAGVAADVALLREIAEERITADLVFEHIAFLASDEMRGRDTPSPELELAAEYLADQLAAYGLEPAGDDGTYIQRWPFQRLALDREASRAGVRTEAGDREWMYGLEYFVIPGPADLFEGTPVLASSPDAVMGGLPDEVQGNPLLVIMPDGLNEEFGTVLQGAMFGGATSVVLILDEETDEAEIHQIAGALEAGAAGQLPFPVLGLRYDVGADILSSVGIDIGGGRDPPAALDGVTLTFQTAFRPEEDLVPNVVGLVRGSDPELADTYIVLTAHFDHVGVGPPDAIGDSIYNGADDNASGTAVLMQVAAALAQLPEPPARSVLFLAVSGEEKGLLGSAHYAQSPTVPIQGIVANLNMDMVGRNHPDTVYVIGEDYTTLGAAAQRVAAEHPDLGLVLAPDPEPEEMVFLRSDHYSFVEVGVPALMFTTWLHDDYHAPSDTPDLIDSDKASRVARLIFYLTHELASDPEAPEWTDEGRTLLDGLPAL